MTAKTFRAVVLHNETRGDRFFGWTTGSEMKRTQDAFWVRADTTEEVAEMAFRLAGNDPAYFDPDAPRTERSMSVGDLVVVWDGSKDVGTDLVVFACESAGWKDVSYECPFRLMTMATLPVDEFIVWDAEDKARRDALKARFAARRAERLAGLAQ